MLLVIGTGSGALWAVLPVAVLVAAYAPGTLPFAVGQAGFTVTVAVLFNLLVPVGWKVGVVRVEDVAIGSAVSVLVGSVLWPHGVGSLVPAQGHRGRVPVGRRVPRPGGRVGSRFPPGDARQHAARARRRPAARRRRPRLSRRARHQGAVPARSVAAARGLDALAPDGARDRGAAGRRGRRRRGAWRAPRRTETLTNWYDRLAQFVAGPLGRPMPALSPPRFAPEDIVDESSGSLYGIWLCEHLDHLSEHLGDLVAPAEQILEIRRKPWWR